MSSDPVHILRCPSCGGRDVRRSQHRGFLDACMARLHRAPHRCRRCHRRFYAFVPAKPKTAERPAPL